MSQARTCPDGPSVRLIENYRRCLEERLEVWFGGGARLQWDPGQTVFVARLDQRTARLQFLPELCQWRLQSGETSTLGSFDRVSKRLRQIFSGLP